MNPPSGGPSTGANSTGQVSSAVMAMRSSVREPRSAMARPSGSSSPPPRPCSARAAMSWPGVCASPHTSEASVNTPTATRNSRRMP
ncbi:hypothetical protein ASF45_10715 [Pseudorhodoferax sp. Leaf265]|nr:hypothetical protein [Pseudorhodoferax sp. Leaf265]KQP05008.1 hypothetical protein ASF45_10715 [Pseudorhodoferax sp. Leaf265]